ncbi:hypothetical protein F2Q69_00016054 [Brassica cretica]|uniref:Uncharacterized protein n=1 Tax=Brassica cretica TaxID=69181 RepID=A0A8S9QMT4_BRACR|nr:hypothetical protein F2Q69_00016054 [Brassica cretica]
MRPKLSSCQILSKDRRNSLPFFGPNITAEVGKGESENLYDVRLISNVSTNSVS